MGVAVATKGASGRAATKMPQAVHAGRERPPGGCKPIEAPTAGSERKAGGRAPNGPSGAASRIARSIRRSSRSLNNMRATNQAATRFASAMERSLQAAATYDGEDEEIALRLTLNGLATLDGAEEIEWRLDPGYYAHRDTSPHGRVLGGLMSCRGDVQHAGGDVPRLGW
jgi:hypothetical protein